MERAWERGRRGDAEGEGRRRMAEMWRKKGRVKGRAKWRERGGEERMVMDPMMQIFEILKRFSL